MKLTACLGMLFGITQGILSQNITGPYYACDFINSFASCDNFITDSYCGSNIVTYANRCEFSKAHCQDPSINLLHIGDCTDVDSATAKPVQGTDVVFDFFCTSLSHMDCPRDQNKVCASDNWTYDNYCEYEKEKCTHRDLTVVSYGECASKP